MAFSHNKYNFWDFSQKYCGHWPQWCLYDFNNVVAFGHNEYNFWDFKNAAAIGHNDAYMTSIMLWPLATTNYDFSPISSPEMSKADEEEVPRKQGAEEQMKILKSLTSRVTSQKAWRFCFFIFNKYPPKNKKNPIKKVYIRPKIILKKGKKKIRQTIN